MLKIILRHEKVALLILMLIILLKQNYTVQLVQSNYTDDLVTSGIINLWNLFNPQLVALLIRSLLLLETCTNSKCFLYDIFKPISQPYRTLKLDA